MVQIRVDYQHYIREERGVSLLFLGRIKMIAPLLLYEIVLLYSPLKNCQNFKGPWTLNVITLL